MLCRAARVTSARLSAVLTPHTPPPVKMFGSLAVGRGGVVQRWSRAFHTPPPPPCSLLLPTPKGHSCLFLHYKPERPPQERYSSKRWCHCAALKWTGGVCRQRTVLTSSSEPAVTHSWSKLWARNHSTAAPGGQQNGGQQRSKEEQEELEALVRMEVEMYRQRGLRVPTHISEDQFAQMLTMSSTRRRKFLGYLCKTEYILLSKQKKKEEKRKASEEAYLKQSEERGKNQHLQYGLWNNTMFLRINKATVNKFYNQRLFSAMLHGQPLVLDLSFEHKMNNMERESCAFQLQMLFAKNRRHSDPYDLHLCNTRHSPDLMRRLQKHIPILHQPTFPMHIWEDCYLDQFPRERLVYLTPHCREELLHYDHDAIYVVGGVVDKSSGDPMTLAKAKAQGIRMQRLPLERYLDWGVGNKCLTLNQIVAIMNDFKLTGDWNQAFSHVPRRKLAQPADEEEAMQMLRRKFQRTSLGKGPPSARKYKRT